MKIMHSPKVDQSLPDPASSAEYEGEYEPLAEEPKSVQTFVPQAAVRRRAAQPQALADAAAGWQSPVQSPAQAAWQQHGMPMQPKRSLVWLWVLLGAVGAVALALVVFFSLKVGTDPYRSLEEFPVENYLRNHESLLGSRFKAELTLEAELGGEMGRGRLFSFRSPSTGRILPVLIPEHIQQGTFDRGQRYLLELEVRQGGTIQANGCRKS